MKRSLIAALLLASVAAEAKPASRRIAIRGDHGHLAGVVKDLEAKGYRHDANATLGVLLVHADTPAARTQVAEAHARGERVLVVVPSEQTLSPKAQSELLHAGAEDIVVHSADFHDVVVDGLDQRLTKWHAIEEHIDAAKHLVTASPASLGPLRQVVEAAMGGDSILIVGEPGTGRHEAAVLAESLRVKTLPHVDLNPPTENDGRFDYAAYPLLQSRRDARTGSHIGPFLITNTERLRPEAQARLAANYTGVPFIATSPTDLVDEVKHGDFDGNLRDQMAGTVIRLLPLRERRQEIVPLAEFFIRQLVSHNPPVLSDAVKAQLMARDYPDNVRELKRLVRQMVSHHLGSGPFTIGDMPPDEVNDLSAAKPERQKP